MIRTFFVACLLLLALQEGHASGAGPWVEPGADGEPRVHLYFFWSETCPHCQEARPFVEGVPAARPWVLLHSLEVSQNPENSRRFADMAASLGLRAEAVPTLIACGRMEVGWQDASTSGAALLRLLDACRAGKAEEGSSPLRLPFVGEVDPARLSLPVLTVMIAGLDAFNPCAFFVLLFLLSLLSHQKDRRCMAVVGGVFVLASGLMYFAFMAAWLNVFELLGAMARVTLVAGIVAILVGAINVKDFFAFGKGVTLSIPESGKPAIYRRARAILQSENPAGMLAATVLLAVAANFYELLCTAGFPMVYTRILTLAELPPGARYAWLALYNAIYVLPLAGIVFAFIVTLGARRLTEREGRLLKLMSGTMMVGLGLVLAFSPACLSSLAATAALVVVALLVTVAAARFTRSENP